MVFLLLPSALFGAYFTQVTDMSLINCVVITALITISFYVTGSFIEVAIVGGLTAVLSGSTITAFARLGIGLPLKLVPLLFVVIYLGCSLIVGRNCRKKQLTFSNFFAELSLVVFSLFLVTRWPFSTAADHIAFLSYEDNAAWVSTVAGIARNDAGHYVEGVGGYVLDPLMSLIYWLHSSGGFKDIPQSIYASIVSSYAFLQFLGILAGAFFVLRIGDQFKQSRILGYISAFASSAMCYAVLQLPRSTGHLTFTGALAFFWLALLFLTHNSSHGGYISTVAILMIVGIVGMWWPFVVVLIVLIAGLTVQNRHQVILTVPSLLRIAKIKLLLVLVGSSVAVFVLIPIFRDSLTAMSIRDFITTSGGVTSVPGYLSLVGVLAIAFMSQKVEDDPKLTIGIQLLASIGIVVVILYFSSIFVGPEFIPKYTYLKTLLLFSISTVPLIVVSILIGVGATRNKNATFVLILVLFVAGNITTGWDINTPRGMSAPLWSSALVEESRENPTAWIICHNFEAERNFDSYQCSRQASALQAKEDHYSGIWRLFQLNSNASDVGNQQGFIELKIHIDEFLNSGGEVILISMEKEFKISDDDRWWMDQLPLDRFKKVGA